MDENVYLGVWTNWSNGTVMGATLTMTRRDGNLLIAFTGFLIPFVASRFWNILCLIFHTYYSTPDPRDAIHHQRQVLLRNSSSPETGLIALFRLFWAWRKSSKGTKRHFNMLPIIFMGICCISAFTAAGGLSSQISTAPGDEVLLKGDNCDISQTPTNISEIAKSTSLGIQMLNDAANYAQQCYSETSSGILDCDRFVVQTLPMAVWDNTTACPFQDNICRSNTSNLLLDTGYIDSNDELGLNAPEDQRFALRYMLQCAPLITEGYSTQVSIKNRSWERYDYGGLFNGTQPLNFTYEVYGLDTQYPVGAFLGGGFNYQLSVLNSPTFQGTTDSFAADFTPNSQLFRSDGDLILVSLSGNGVYFLDEMDDDWYRATLGDEEIVYDGGDGASVAYTPAEPSSPMGCVEQWQWCNSAYSREIGCGPVASLLDSVYGAAPLFNVTPDDLNQVSSNTTATGIRLMWPALIQMTGISTLHDVLGQLGAKALASQSLLDTGLQYPLPQNQWQLDVTNWFNIVLASLQSSYVNTAIGSTDPDINQFAITPDFPEEKKLCSSQKIRSTSYSSFSLFALLFTYITGSLIIILSFTLEPLLRCIQKRRKYRGDYAILEWTTNDALQLHRLAQEEIGRGTWSGCTDVIPTTKRGEILASLDVRDVDHPVLAQKSEQIRFENKNAMISSVNSIDGETVKGSLYSLEPESTHLMSQP